MSPGSRRGFGTVQTGAVCGFYWACLAKDRWAKRELTKSKSQGCSPSIPVPVKIPGANWTPQAMWPPTKGWKPSEPWSVANTAAEFHRWTRGWCLETGRHGSTAWIDSIAQGHFHGATRVVDWYHAAEHVADLATMPRPCNMKHSGPEACFPVRGCSNQLVKPWFVRGSRPPVCIGHKKASNPSFP